MVTESQELPIGMIAQQLQRAFEAECFARLAAAGFTGLRVRHSILLNALGPEGSRITALAAELGMTKQAMGELVDDLETSGYITRTNDPDDRRARLVVFTEKGELAFERAFVILGEMEKEYAALVGVQRYADARATFDELVEALERTEA